MLFCVGWRLKTLLFLKIDVVLFWCRCAKYENIGISVLENRFGVVCHRAILVYLKIDCVVCHRAKLGNITVIENIFGVGVCHCVTLENIFGVV